MRKPRKKPCPYCKSKFWLKEITVKESCYVECQNCGASAGPDSCMAEAVLKWNRRHDPKKPKCAFCGGTFHVTSRRITGEYQSLCLQCGSNGPFAGDRTKAVELLDGSKPNADIPF